MPGVSPAEELSALPAAELAVLLAEAYRVIGELTARAEQLAVVNERLTARVEELERQVRRDSASSSRPPSSDSPYKKKGRDRSLRERGKRRPGKQPGDPGTTMKLIDDPDARFWFPPAACRRCGKGLAGAAVLAQRRHQVTDIGRAPPPVVTEYVAQAKQCPCCATVTEGELPPFVRARASFGPETCAQAANLACGNYIPVGRAAVLLREMAGVAASTGWMAGIRGRAAALVAGSGFTDRVRELLKMAPAVHADETPARAAGGMRYVHLACTAYLTHMHTGGAVRRRHRRRRRARWLRRGHRPGRLLRLQPSHRCAARLVRGPLRRYRGYADTEAAAAGHGGARGCGYRHNHRASRKARSWSGGR